MATSFTLDLTASPWGAPIVDAGFTRISARRYLRVTDGDVAQRIELRPNRHGGEFTCDLTIHPLWARNGVNFDVLEPCIWIKTVCEHFGGSAQRGTNAPTWGFNNWLIPSANTDCVGSTTPQMPAASFNHQPHSPTRGTTNSTLTSNLAIVCFALGALLTHNVSLTANPNGSPNTNPFRNGSLTATRPESRHCTTTGLQLAVHKLKL